MKTDAQSVTPAGIHWILLEDKTLFLETDRIGDVAPDTFGTLDTIVEETDDHINDEAAVDSEHEDQSVTTASESETSSNHQVVSTEVGKTNMESFSFLETI